MNISSAANSSFNNALQQGSASTVLSQSRQPSNVPSSAESVAGVEQISSNNSNRNPNKNIAFADVSQPNSATYANTYSNVAADVGFASSTQSQQEQKSQIESKKEQAELALIQKQISALASRDREVRAHEQAHMAAGGQYAGAARYTFERGPDGVNYAVGGEVPIDVSPAATPQQTIEKAQVVKRAALAPAEPSGQDRKVASLAAAMEQQARAELIELKRESQVELAEDRAVKSEGQKSDEVRDDEVAPASFSVERDENSSAHSFANDSQSKDSLDTQKTVSTQINSHISTLLNVQSNNITASTFSAVI